MNRFPDNVVAAEGERHVADTAAHERVRKRRFDPSGRLDEIDPVTRVFLDAGGHGEDVRVEDDVGRVESDFVGQHAIGALADLDLALGRVRLALLVEGHDDDRRAVVATEPGLLDERFLAFLEADRVDDGLALHAFQSRNDDRPLRRVDHDRQTRHVGLGGDQVEEGDHRPLGVEHALVHVDVDDLRAVLDLLACDGDSRRVIVGFDQASEDRRARDVAALADIDEQVVRPDVERLQTGQPAPDGQCRHAARRLPAQGIRQSTDMFGRGSAAAADQVDQPALCELADDGRRGLRLLVVLAELVRQPGVRVRADPRIGNTRKLSHVRAKLAGAQRAVQADHERPGVAHRIPERLGRLPGQRAPGSIRDRARDHDRQFDAGGAEAVEYADDRGFGVQRIEDRLDHQEIGAALGERRRGLLVGRDEVVEAHVAVARVVDVGRDRRGAVGRPENARHPARHAGPFPRGVRTGPRQARRRRVQFHDQVLHAVVRH